MKFIRFFCSRFMIIVLQNIWHGCYWVHCEFTVVYFEKLVLLLIFENANWNVIEFLRLINMKFKICHFLKYCCWLFLSDESWSKIEWVYLCMIECWDSVIIIWILYTELNYRNAEIRMLIFNFEQAENKHLFDLKAPYWNIYVELVDVVVSIFLKNKVLMKMSLSKWYHHHDLEMMVWPWLHRYKYLLEIAISNASN